MPFNPHSFLQEEILTQPDDWARVVSRVDEARAALPPVGARLAVVGCGTSFYMAQAYAALRERAGQGETDAFAASEHRLHRAYDAVLVITRSGTTTEVLEVLTGSAARDADHGDRRRRPAPRPPSWPTCDPAERGGRAVGRADPVRHDGARPAAGLARRGPHRRHRGRARGAGRGRGAGLAGLADAEQLTFLGRGWTVGLAEEAGLKLRESAQFWTESYPAMEYRHGPISIAAPGRATWAFGEVPEGLADQVAATGAHFEHRDIDPMADLVRVHRLCLAKARQADVDPDHPRSPDPLDRPRTPPGPVALPGMREVVAAVDVGGTRVKAALVDRSYDVVAALTVPTPADVAADVGGAVASAVADLAGRAGRRARTSRCGSSAAAWSSRGWSTSDAAWACGRPTWAGATCRSARR